MGNMVNIVKKRTKIVVTLGPATNTPDKFRELLNAGANVVRINTSHGNQKEHADLIKMIRKVSDEMGLFIPIIVDLQGPKIRIGQLKKEICLCKSDILILKYQLEQNEKESIVPVDYSGIANDVKIGDEILIDDGKIQLKVLSNESEQVTAEVVNGGILKSRKGLNIPGTTASLSAVTEKDRLFIKFAVDNGADYIALSFVRKAEDIMMVKKYLQEYDANIPVIAKIEKPQALENLEEIVNVAEGIMVARGDLGIEISPEQVPIAQKNIINAANKAQKIVIVATQMLETMIQQPIPTRAEASDVANAIIDGADAIMLSGETSVGAFAVESVKMMSNIAETTEASIFCPYDTDLGINPNYQITPQAIVASAVKLADNVSAKMILAFTHTGYSTRFLSKQRSKIPVLVISDKEDTCRKLNLAWGVIPIYREWDLVFDDDFLHKLDDFFLNQALLKEEDRIIIIGSLPRLIKGRTNFMRVHRIGA